LATLHVKVVPGSSRNRIAGRYGDGIKLQVTAAPEKGKANEAVVELLSRALALKPNQITIVSGHTQARKTLRIEGLDQPTLDAKLATFY
jgi:uncharacterized protein (TIGR00251 family)